LKAREKDEAKIDELEKILQNLKGVLTGAYLTKREIEESKFVLGPVNLNNKSKNDSSLKRELTNSYHSFGETKGGEFRLFVY
jgi:hypothetical protein